jgi:hypothetical protein
MNKCNKLMKQQQHLMDINLYRKNIVRLTHHQRMNFGMKDAVQFFFRSIEGQENMSQCMCGVTRNQNQRAGYGNLSQHLTTCHPDWKVVEESFLSLNEGKNIWI